MSKPYKAKSLAGAQREVRQERKVRASLTRLITRLAAERKLLAKLAAKGPAFHNPLEIAAAEGIRDAVLARECRLKPDGSPLT